MSLRVVLYAEGPGDLGAADPLLPAPGAALPAPHWGPAHHLVIRSIVLTGRAPEAAVQFQSPQRTSRGRVARGSHFLDRETLRRLLTWLRPDDRPHLAVVLVDADGRSERRAELMSWIADKPVPHVVGVAIQEFESWLIADPQAVAAATVAPFPQQPNPEGMNCRQAREILSNATGRDDAKAKRTQIAQTCDLQRLSRTCRAFEDFLSDLRATPP